MLVGISVIGISVIVKHVQQVRIIRAFCLLGGGDLLGFSVPRWTEKIAGLGFAGGESSTQADSMKSSVRFV